MVSATAFAVAAKASPPVEAQRGIEDRLSRRFCSAQLYGTPLIYAPIYYSAPYVAYGQPPQCTLAPPLCATYQHCCSCY